MCGAWTYNHRALEFETKQNNEVQNNGGANRGTPHFIILLIIILFSPHAAIDSVKIQFDFCRKRMHLPHRDKDSLTVSSIRNVLKH
jgi:hypothetical protein